MAQLIIYKGEEKREIHADIGSNLLKELIKNGIYIDSPCGGMGLCGKCRVEIIDGKNKTYSLACRTIIDRDMEIRIPIAERRDAQIMTSGEAYVDIDPSIQSTIIELSKPSIEDQLSDVDRLEEALGARGAIPNSIMPDISEILRQNSFKVQAIRYEDEILSIAKAIDKNKDHYYGIAVDIGTTTIVGYLLDLKKGEELGLYSSLNPQSRHGADVITRIDYTMESKDGLNEMRDLIRDSINIMVADLCSKSEVTPDSIYEIDIVGNTVMMHIFAGLPVKNIALSPFIPVVGRRLELNARDIDIGINPNGKIVIPPMISGYIGADAIAAILSCNMHKDEEISLLIDIGTNGEIALGNKDGIVLCSTAAGPAFEGARIECGLGGVEGAINRVFIHEELEFTTIKDAPAIGICGSGIVDVVAQMLKVGLIDSTGRMLSIDEIDDTFPKNIKDRVVSINDQPALILQTDDKSPTGDIYISQKDIREVQLAKGAIAAGIEILIDDMNISYEDIDNVYLAGGFGNYIDHTHAADIGLIPDALKNKIKTIGNGAGVGAKMMLLSKHMKKEADSIRDMSRYIELSARIDFQTIFVDLLEF
ncbi:MAG: DUF4445 domain-containing protein [Clostridiales bacterium]|nr:DUF4445 domain-containing protein [Clostridiales bacterium]